MYFAARGFVTVIPDYRLAPQTTYPGPVEDVRDALAWAVVHPADLGPDADIASVFLLGHSAGGVHALTLLLEPTVLASVPDLRARIKGATIASAPCHFEPKGHKMDAREPVDMYYGSQELATAREPLALLRSAPAEAIGALPPLVLLKCEHDPAWFKVVLDDFRKALEERGVKSAQIFAEGHNHISFSWALGTGQGEKWAEEVVAWMVGL